MSITYVEYFLYYTLCGFPVQFSLSFLRETSILHKEPSVSAVSTRHIIVVASLRNNPITAQAVHFKLVNMFCTITRGHIRPNIILYHSTTVHTVWFTYIACYYYNKIYNYTNANIILQRITNA